MYYPNASILEIFFYRTKIIFFAYLKLFYLCFFNFRDFIDTRKLKNSKKNKSAFVFANGPSLSLLSPDKIRDYGFDVFAVNGYLNSTFGEKVIPNYYVLSDPSYLNFEKHYFNDIAEKDLRSNVIRKIKEYNPILFVPVRSKCSYLVDKVFKFVDIENELSKNASNILSFRGYPSMTAYKSLSIALYLGYENIYICGFDNNYFKFLSSDIHNNIYYEDTHFYDSGKKRLINDIAPDVGRYLFKEHILFTSFEKFKNNSSKIFNLDPSSLNTFFPKEHYLNIYN